MKKLLYFLYVGFHIQQVFTDDVIYRLSQEEYSRMPPKVHLDQFAHCLHQPGGVYCTAHADVVSDAPSDLLDMMRGYSAFTVAHFNYTSLLHGLCLTRTCRKFYNGTSRPELQVTMEACLNETLSREYGLKTRIAEINCYFEDETKNHSYFVDWMDWATVAMIFSICALNIIGSIYDCNRDQNKPGNKFLLSFSWRLNWRELVAPPSTDPRAEELLSIHGVRCLTCAFIVLLHSIIITLIAVEDPQNIEKKYDSTLYHAILNGTLTTQSFNLMSGFLLTYNLQKTEKKPLTWTAYVKSILLRYIRLNVINLIAVMLAATWLRFGKGPLWQEFVGSEVDHCRSNWVYNLLLVNNYVDFSLCSLHTWTSASDFHLHILGLTVILLAPDEARRRKILTILFVIGCLLPTYTVFSMDLDGTFISKPEVLAILHDMTFTKLYIPTHNNIPVFIIGMTFGYVVYDLQKRNVTTLDHTKYCYLYWLLVPLILWVMATGGYLFYQEGPRASLWVRSLFAMIVKPTFGLIVMLIIFGAILKIETLYRGVLEWRGFVPLAKLSYSVYTLHMLVARCIYGTITMQFTTSTLISIYVTNMTVTMIVATVSYVCVESPVRRLAKMAFADCPQPARAQLDKDPKKE